MASTTRFAPWTLWHVFITNRMKHGHVPGPADEHVALVMGKSLQAWRTSYYQEFEGWAMEAAVDAIQLYSEAHMHHFWVWGGYPYLRGKVLRRLGMGGPMAMHALVCGLLHGQWERQETVVVDGVEEEGPAEVKVAMHLCGKGRLGHGEGRSTCCILPWHL
jgi:hypothetical protein